MTRYKLGRHILVHGDSTSTETYKHLFFGGALGKQI